jgi:hypothetical protein
VSKKSQGKKGNTIFQRERERALGITKEVSRQLKSHGETERQQKRKVGSST